MRFPTSASAALARPPRSHHIIHNHTQHTARAHFVCARERCLSERFNMLLVALACSCLPRPAIEFNALARSPLSDGLDGLPQKYSIDICQLRGGERNDTAFGWRYMIKTPIVASAAFVGYLSGSQFLDLALVQALGVDRSASADAFAPFVTLLGLVYSVILAQIYTYYFERQGAIQTAIFDEAAALRALQGCVEAIDDESLMEQRALLLSHTRTQRMCCEPDSMAFSAGRSPRLLVKLLSALETASDTTLRRVAVLQLARVNVGRGTTLVPGASQRSRSAAHCANRDAEADRGGAASGLCARRPRRAKARGASFWRPSCHLFHHFVLPCGPR